MTSQTRTLTQEDTAPVAVATSPARILQNYIGGRWVSAKTSSFVDVTNPANGKCWRARRCRGRGCRSGGDAASAAWPTGALLDR
jgi:hypothetical protein